MDVPVIENKLRVSRDLLVKIHLTIKLVSNGLINEFSNREISVLSELYLFGGIENKETSDKFIEHCFKMDFAKQGATNSVLNVLSKGRKFNIVKRKKANFWKLDKEYLPEFESDKLVFKYLVTNI